MTNNENSEIVQAINRCLQEAAFVAERLLERFSSPGSVAIHGAPEPTRKSEALLTVEEAAKFLAVSSRTIYSYVHRGKLPTRRVGSEIRFCREELDAWTKEQNTINDVGDEATSDERHDRFSRLQTSAATRRKEL